MAENHQTFHEYDEETEQRIDQQGYDWFRAGVVITDKLKKKFLVIQEAHDWIRGLWNIPVGHVKRGESIMDAAIREAREESGFSCKLTGICHIGQRCDNGNPYVAIIFTAITDGVHAEVNQDDIMNVAWKSIDEIECLAQKGQVRNKDMMLTAIHSVREGIVGNLDLFRVYTPR